MFCSVIIPVEHGGRFLAAAVSSAVRMTAPDGGFEVIVGMPEGDHESRAVVHGANAQVLVAEAKGTSHAAVLNAACRASQGRVLAFADDDCVFPANWLLVLERTLRAHPDAVLLGGSDRLPSVASSFAFALDVAINSWAGSGRLRGGKGLSAGGYYPKLWGMALVRDRVTQIALASPEGPCVFDERLGVMESADLAARCRAAGWSIVREEEWVIEHHRDTNWWLFALRCWRMAAASRRLGTHRLANGLLAAWGVVLPVALLTAVAFPCARAVVGAMAGLYALLLLAAGQMGWFATGRAGVAWRVPLLLLEMHLVRGWGYLLGGWRMAR